MCLAVSACVSDVTCHIVDTPLSTTHLDGIELAIMIVATFGQAVSGDGPGLHIITVLIIWRVFVSVLVSYFQPCTSAEHDPIRWELEWAVTTP